MRTATILLALGAVASAQQIPLADQLKGWFAKASTAVASFGAAASATAAANIPNIPNPVNAGAAAVAAGQVQSLTLENHKAVLLPGAATTSTGYEEWMVFVTGGNKTCFGMCDHADTEWNKSVPILTATKGAPHLARLDCELEPVLCHAWSVSAPQVLYLRIPQPTADQSRSATEIRYIAVNRTSTTSAEFASLYTKDKYKNTTPYEGFWHPFDGTLANAGLHIPFGYAVWAFGLVPSWMFMIGISLFSRTFVSRRFAPQPQAQPHQRAAPARPART